MKCRCETPTRPPNALPLPAIQTSTPSAGCVPSAIGAAESAAGQTYPKRTQRGSTAANHKQGSIVGYLCGYVWVQIVTDGDTQARESVLFSDVGASTQRIRNAEVEGSTPFRS